MTINQCLTSNHNALRLRLVGPLSKLRQTLPGASLCAIIAMAATFVSTLHGGPQFLYALIFGIALHGLHAAPEAHAGIDFCARGLLRLGVGLLGARITADQIIGLGWESTAIVVVAVASTLVLALVIGPWLGLSRAQGALVGGSVAICGASAALAISAVLPREKDDEQFTLMVVLTVTVFSTVAMVVYPALATALGLSPMQSALFLGASIHDVAQVVGAGYSLSQEIGDRATIVKLMRVSFLAGVVLVIAFGFARHPAQGEAPDPQGSDPARPPGRPPLAPWFLWMFMALVVANSSGLFNPPVQAGLSELSRACLLIAIAALGIKTSLRGLAGLGMRPLLLLLIETVWIAAVVLALLLFGKP